MPPVFAAGIAEYLATVAKALGPMASPKGLSLEQRRDRFDMLAEALRQPYADGMVVRNNWVARPGREIPVRIYRPAGPGPQAAILYCHGGGYVSGSIESHDAITARLAALTGATVVSVHYRRPPENPFPAPNDDCFEVLLWLRARAGDLGIDPARIAVAGDSAGGNLVASVAWRSGQEGLPPLRAQALIYPGLCADIDTTPSYRTNIHDPFLSVDSMRFYRAAYLGGTLRTADPYAAPLHADDVSGLPPTLILLAEHDPLYDDGRLFFEKLQAAGVQASLRTGDGLIHGFLRTARFCAAAEREFVALAAFLADHLR
jgi:acetyl esterase